MAKTTSALDDAMDADGSDGPPADKLDGIRNKVAELREHELEKSRIEETLKAVNIRINNILWQELPTVMDDAAVPNLTIAAEGNKPAYTVRVDDHYKANIPDDKQPEAYEYLKGTGNADLIKSTYTISFGLREAAEAAEFETMLHDQGVTFDKKQGVPWNTLTAWFREEYKRRPLPIKAMEVLGATVGRVAKVVKQKEKR